MTTPQNNSDTFRFRIPSVTVIERTGPANIAVHSFPETPEGNRLAETLFRALVAARRPNESAPVENAIKEGFIDDVDEWELYLVHSETGEAAEPVDPALMTPTVIAETHDDDRRFEIPMFDCTRWFAQASDEALAKLIKCDFGGDLGADAVAEFYDGRHSDITAMFQHKQGGFECYVNPSQARAWLQKHRPALFATIPTE